MYQLKIFTMKFYLIYLMMLFSISLKAQSGKDSIELVNLLVKDYKTMENYDSKTHLENCTDKYLLVEDGEIWDMKKELDFYNKNSGRVMNRKNFFDIKYVRVQGEFAYTVYNLRSEIVENGNRQILNWVESVIFRKVKGRWKIEVIHSTKLQKPT